MKVVKVNKDACICCGACASINDKVFEIDNNENVAVAIMEEIPEEYEEEVMDAAEGCPTDAIEVTEK